MCIAISRVYNIIEELPNIVKDGLVYKDTHRKVALLRYSAAFRPKSGYTRAKQGWSFDEGYKYFVAINTVAKMVPAFFNAKPENMKYSLIVDCTTYIHSCCLLIRRRPDARATESVYIFHAFDPNTSCISECFSKVAKQIGAVTEIKVWSTKKGNPNGLCFGLNWRFIYSVMCEGHDPLLNEKIVGLYKFSSNRASPYPNENGLISSIGFMKKRGKKQRGFRFYFQPRNP